MRILYTTDLQGDIIKYEKIFDIVNSKGPNVVCLGADILPKHGPNDESLHEIQSKFVNGYLPEFLHKMEVLGVPTILDFGNDDMHSVYPQFIELIDSMHAAYYTHGEMIKLGEFHFYGMHLIPDCPFALKDWCRKDDPTSVPPLKEIGDTRFVSCAPGNLIEIDDKYFEYNASLKDVLECMSWQFSKQRKEIWLTHSPPKGLGLDMVSEGKFIQIGSAAITQFLEERQPLISLHGHAHSSHKISGMKHNMIGKTYCIQPGVNGIPGKLNYCVVDPERASHILDFYEE